MRRSILLAAAVLFQGCGGDDGPAEGRGGTYQTPDIRGLLAQVAEPAPNAAITTRVYGAMTERLKETPAAALWGAVRKAESEGLTELYGVEYFGLDEPSYMAVVFVRTPGRTACLYANGDLHDRRDLQRTVPAQTLAAEEFGLLRDRIGVHLPLSRSASVESAGTDTEVVLLHVFRDGRSASALWRVPAPEWALERAPLRAYRRDYGVAAILRALWACVPLAFFDGDGVRAEDAYASLPGY